MDKQNLIKDLGEKLRAIRREKNMTQQQLAKLADLSYKYVGEIERAEKNPSIGVLNRIANAVEIDLLELLEFKSSAEPTMQEKVRNDLIIKLNRQIKNLKPEELEKLSKIIRILSEKD